MIKKKKEVVGVQITKKYITENMHYKNNKIIDVKRLVLHSVGVAQPNPDVFAKGWNSPDKKYPTQLIIGTDKVYEVLPCTLTKGKAVFTWHVGNANSNSIGAEMTEPDTIKYTSGANWTDLDPEKTKAHVMATYKNAVDVFAQLCVFHGLDPLVDGVVLSHRECAKRGIGTNHADVEHLWDAFGLSMDQFRQDVKSAMGGKTSVIKPNTILGHSIKVGSLVKIDPLAKYYTGKFIPEWIKKHNWYVSAISGDRVVIDKSEDGNYSINSPINSKFLSLASSKVSSFKVQVSVNNLNIRTGPATTYDRIGYIPVGVYTIVETSGDWGRLKSKQLYQGKQVNGWINLKYVKKI